MAVESIRRPYGPWRKLYSLLRNVYGPFRCCPRHSDYGIHTRCKYNCNMKITISCSKVWMSPEIHTLFSPQAFVYPNLKLYPIYNLILFAHRMHPNIQLTITLNEPSLWMSGVTSYPESLHTWSHLISRHTSYPGLIHIWSHFIPEITSYL